MQSLTMSLAYFITDVTVIAINAFGNTVPYTTQIEPTGFFSSPWTSSPWTLARR